MDYEQKYKEALSRAKKLYKDAVTLQLEQDIKDYETIFPELNESEDERIRKEIISALKWANHKGVYDKHIAWLEKQGEKTQVDGFDAELKESDDERIRKLTIHHLDRAYQNCAFDEYKEEIEKCIAWLEKQGEQKSVLDELEMTLSVSEEGYLRSNIKKLIKELKQQ